LANNAVYRTAFGFLAALSASGAADELARFDSFGLANPNETTGLRRSRSPLTGADQSPPALL